MRYKTMNSKLQSIFSSAILYMQCRSLLILLTVFVLSISYLLFQVNAQAYNLVFSDQIDLFMGYLQKENLLTLFFQQHGPHRQGMGAILMLPVLKFANWDMRALSYLTTLIMVLGTCFLFLSMRYKKILLLPSMAIIIMSLSLGSEELLTVTPNISHSALPFFFSCAIFWLILRYRLIGLWPNAAILIIVILSLFTGFGIFIFFSYFLVFSLHLAGDLIKKAKMSGGSIALIVATYVLLIVSLVLFFINYSFSKGEGCSATALSNMSDVVKYAFAVASIPLGGSNLGVYAVPIGFTVISVLSVTGLLALRNLLSHRDMTSFALLVVILASGGFVINVAIGRHCLGIDSAYASRYYQFTTLGILGTLFALGIWCREISSILVNTLAIILIGVTLIYVNPTMKRMGTDFYGHKNNFVLCIQRGESVHECNAKFTIYPADEKRLDSLLSMIKQANGD
jgi:hypothetical protein